METGIRVRKNYIFILLIYIYREREAAMICFVILKGWQLAKNLMGSLVARDVVFYVMVMKCWGVILFCLLRSWSVVGCYSWPLLLPLKFCVYASLPHWVLAYFLTVFCWYFIVTSLEQLTESLKDMLNYQNRRKGVIGIKSGLVVCRLYM
jgi:uncharacterized membrane protein